MRDSSITKQLETLKELISIGEKQADNGEFVDYPLSVAIADIENNDLSINNTCPTKYL